jgi:formylglycine-generating enzyme required for sulfatase activity
MAQTKKPAPPKPKPPAKPFVQKFPGSLVEFEMVPLPFSSASGKRLWIAKTEVTWDLFDIFVFRLDLTQEQQAKGVDADARPSKPYGAPDRGYGHQGYAAISIQYEGAVRFCKWLSAKTGRTYRLPTVAEWEKAALAGAAASPTGKALEDFAWFWDNADDKAHPVASKKPNAWGIYDMYGNAGEWCAPNKPTEKPVVCGGSFMDKAAQVGAKARAFYTPDWQMQDAQIPKSKWWLSDGGHVGFRILCEE